MTQKQTQLFSESARGSGQLARERLVWALQPLAVLVVVLGWVLNPEVVDHDHVTGVAIWGYVFGVVIGVLGAREKVLKHIQLQFDGGVYIRNRVPEEFYWGAKSEVLFHKEQS